MRAILVKIPCPVSYALFGVIVLPSKQMTVLSVTHFSLLIIHYISKVWSGKCPGGKCQVWKFFGWKMSGGANFPRWEMSNR